MSDSYRWRRKFIEIVEEVYRELGFDPPPMTHDSDVSLVMELDIDGTTYEVVHNPLINNEYCLVEARLGRIQDANQSEILLHFLAENLSLARQYHGCFAADIKDDTLLFNFSMALEELRGNSLLRTMRETASDAINWRSMLSGSGMEFKSSMSGISASLA